MLRIVLLAVALSTGGAAAWLTLSVRTPAPAAVAQAPSPPALPEILVVSTDLGVGQTLTKENTRWQAWPESALNPGYVTRSAKADAQEKLSGSIVRTRMVAGEPVRDDKLAPVNSGFLSAMLPPGKRAVAVRVTAENSAGGFVLPNDRVDVLHTTALPGQNDGQKEHVTHTILENVPVLAIDQTVDEKSKDGKEKDEKAKKPAMLGKTATLELDAAQAEVVAAAEATGMLALALRSSADNAEPTRVEPQRVKRGSTDVSAVTRLPQTVRYIRAGQVQDVKRP